MQKKMKRFVNLAQATKERIIVYSNNDEDDKHLVAENSGGEIKIFFEKENECYNKNIGQTKKSEEIHGLLIYMLCNLMYIIWLEINYTLFSSIEISKMPIILCILLSLVWIFVFFILFWQNKYVNDVIVAIIISMILNNIAIYIMKDIFIFAISFAYVVIILLTLIGIFIGANIKYIFVYINERKNIEQKSKHSAEHMMGNYIKRYQNYANSVKKIKKCSRFSLECGGLYGDATFEQTLSQIISNCLVMILLIKILITTKIFIPKDIVDIFYITAFLMGVFVAIWLLIDIFSSIICSLLILFSQFITTLPKRKIKYKDLKMAQMLSKEFIEWQYPDDKIEPKQKTE